LPQADLGLGGLVEVFLSPMNDGLSAEKPSRQKKAGRTSARKGAPERNADALSQEESWGPVAIENDLLLSALEREPAELCSLLMLRAALLGKPGFVERAMSRGAVSIIHVPDKDWGRCAARAWDLIVN
jgi:hypothetical protein